MSAAVGPERKAEALDPNKCKHHDGCDATKIAIWDLPLKALKMAFTYAPDFVVKGRRRPSRRQPVDPCLGYYEELPTSPNLSLPVETSLWTIRSSEPIKEAHIVNQISLEHPTGHMNDDVCEDMPWGGLPGDTLKTSSHPDIQTPARIGKDSDMPLTVEEFLRRAATPNKRYSTRRRKRPKQPQTKELLSTGSEPLVDSDTHDPDYCPDNSSSSPPRLLSKRRGHQIVWTSDEDEHTAEEPPKKRCRRQKKTKPLSARLLAAAVVTGVDVVGGILLPDNKTGPPDAQGCRRLKARRPPPFVPDNRAPSPAEKSKTDRRRFVDPRKIAPFKHAHFEFAPRFPAETDNSEIVSSGVRKEPRPITAWIPVGDAAVAHAGYSSNAASAPPRRVARAPMERFVTVPLKLVPATHSRSVEQVLDRPRRRPAHTRMTARRAHNAPILSMEPSTLISSPSSRRRPAVPILHFKKQSPFFIPNSSPLDPTGKSNSPCPSSDSDPVLDDCTQIHINSAASADIEEKEQSPLLAPIDVDGQDAPNDAHLSQLDLAPSPDAANADISLQGLLVAPVPGTSQTITLTRSAPQRPLKSLVSMLDKFREIARSATHKSLVSASRTRPRTAKRDTGSLVPLGHALPSDDSVSLRRLRARVTDGLSKSCGKVG